MCEERLRPPWGIGWSNRSVIFSFLTNDIQSCLVRQIYIYTLRWHQCHFCNAYCWYDRYPLNREKTKKFWFENCTPKTVRKEENSVLINLYKEIKVTNERFSFKKKKSIFSNNLQVWMGMGLLPHSPKLPFSVWALHILRHHILRVCLGALFVGGEGWGKVAFIWSGAPFCNSGLNKHLKYDNMPVNLHKWCL